MRERLHVLVVGISISILFACIYVYKPTLFVFLENKTYDTLLRSTLKGHDKALPVIVDLDERSLSQLGQWPWPRYRVATLLSKIQELGATSIGIDIVFAEEDQTSPKQLQSSIKQELNINLQFQGLPDELKDNDALLAKALARGNHSLGYKLLTNQDGNNKTPCLIHPQNIIFVGTSNSMPKENTLFNAKGVVCNINTLAQAAQSSGFINTLSDIDGVQRRTPLLMRYQGKIYPSLALATLMQAFDKRQVIINTNSTGIESLLINDTLIPTDPYGNLLINYYGRGRTFEYISAVDLLSDKIPKEKINNRVVLIGTSATGLSDLRVTPLDAEFPGVEIQATIIDNILNKEFISRPYYAIAFEFLSILCWGIISAILLAYSRAGWSFILLITLSCGMWYGAEWALIYWSVIVLPTVTILTQFTNFSAITLLKYWQEEKKAKQQAAALVQAQNVTIRGLASLAETRDPETGGHILRTQHYVKLLGEHLRTHPKFKDFLTDDTIDKLFKMAPLHDIGKVGVPDRILLKPGHLTPEEFEQMKLHTVHGYKTIQTIEEDLGPNPFLFIAKQIIYSHQEKWDGSGYPQGLKGEEIPIPGRLMALADVYDALISKRVYKKAIPHDKAVGIILHGRGTHFDPDITDAFMEIHEAFRVIALQFIDQNSTAVEGSQLDHPATIDQDKVAG